MAFEFQPYENRSLGAILELMQGGARARAQAARQSGDARARAMEISGQHSAQMWGSLGQIAQGVAQQYAQHQAQAPQREMQALQLQSMRSEAAGQDAELESSNRLRQLFSSEEPPAPEAIFQAVGPERGLKIVQGLKALQGDAAKEYGSQQTVVRDVLAGMEALPEDLRAQYYPTIRQNLLSKGVIQPGDAPEQYDAAWFQTARNYGKGPERVGTREIKTRNPDGSEAIQIVQDTPGQTFTSAPVVEKPNAPQVGSFGDYLGRYASEKGRSVEQLTPSDYRTAKAQYEAAGRAPQAANHEPLEAIMVNGEAVLVPRSQAVGKTPATNRQRTTEDERKSVGWYQQMRDATATIDALEDQLTEKELFQIQSLPHEHLMGMANRNQLSEAAKRYLRAFTQFSEARLRSVSGAAISTGEYQSDRQTYGKQYGETGSLREDRRRAREVVIQATAARAGVAMPKDGGAEVPAAVSAVLKNVGDGRHTLSDGSVWIKQGSSIRKAH